MSDEAIPQCQLCAKPPAYPGARFCGAACCARYEGGERRKSEELISQVDEPGVAKSAFEFADAFIAEAEKQRGKAG